MISCYGLYTIDHNGRFQWCSPVFATRELMRAEMLKIHSRVPRWTILCAEEDTLHTDEKVDRLPSHLHMFGFEVLRTRDQLTRAEVARQKDPEEPTNDDDVAETIYLAAIKRANARNFKRRMN